MLDRWLTMIRQRPAVDARPHVHWFIRLCAYAIPVCVFPSSLWRLVEVVPNEACHTVAWEPYYIAILSLVSMGASVLCVGLVQRWGEVVPGWVPVIGGRIVPVRVVTAAASAGIVVLAVVLSGFVISSIWGSAPDVPEVPGCPSPSERPEYALIAAAYAPLPLWLPLLVMVTVAYYRRRTR